MFDCLCCSFERRFCPCLCRSFEPCFCRHVCVAVLTLPCACCVRLSFDIVDIKATDGVQRRGPSAVQDRLPAGQLQSLEARRQAHQRRADPDADQREKLERRKVSTERDKGRSEQRQEKRQGAAQGQYGAGQEPDGRSG